MLEQHNKILAELILIEKICKNVVLFIVEYLHLTLNNYQLFHWVMNSNIGRKHTTLSSGTLLKTETIKMHQLKSKPKLQSKDKESTPLYLDLASSWVSTEVDYTTTIYPKPTREELDIMVNAEKYASEKNIGEKL